MLIPSILCRRPLLRFPGLSSSPHVPAWSRGVAVRRTRGPLSVDIDTLVPDALTPAHWLELGGTRLYKVRSGKAHAYLIYGLSGEREKVYEAQALRWPAHARGYLYLRHASPTQLAGAEIRLRVPGPEPAPELAPGLVLESTVEAVSEAEDAPVLELEDPRGLDLDENAATAPAPAAEEDDAAPASRARKFSVVASPATVFTPDGGHDLLGPTGLPWAIPVGALVRTPSRYASLRPALTGALPAPVVEYWETGDLDFARNFDTVIHSLRQPFVLDLAQPLRAWVVNGLHVSHFVLGTFNAVALGDSWRPVYRGVVHACFERFAAGSDQMVLRIVRALTPIVPADERHGTGKMLAPTPGELLPATDGRGPFTFAPLRLAPRAQGLHHLRALLQDTHDVVPPAVAPQRAAKRSPRRTAAGATEAGDPGGKRRAPMSKSLSIGTLDPAKLTRADLLDLSGGKRPKLRVRGDAAAHSVGVYYGRFERGARGDPFPEGTVGFLYACGPDKRQIRFRVTGAADPATFAQGEDLKLPDGTTTWHLNFVDGILLMRVLASV